MNRKFLDIGMVSIIVLIVTSLIFLRKNPNIQWIKDLGYEVWQVHDLSIGNTTELNVDGT